MSVIEPLHRLLPFEETALSGSVSLHATAARRKRGLTFFFRLRGENPDALSQLELGTLKDRPARRRQDGLWQRTCLEVFMAVPGGAGYVELNVSPTGDWNLYGFDDYRRGMHRIEASAPEVDRSDTEGEVSWRIDMEQAGTAPEPAALLSARHLSLSLTAVLASTDGARAYLALAHCGEKPDFHIRESFIITL